MIYSKEELQAIGDWAVEHDIFDFSGCDIYGRLIIMATLSPISSLSVQFVKQTI